MGALTPQQQRFVDAYAGNARETAAAVGVSTARATRLLKNPKVAAAVRARDEKTTPADPVDALIASRQARQRRYAEIAVGNGPDALKALELLSKTCGDFVQKIEFKGEVRYRVLADPFTTGVQTQTAQEVANGHA